MQDKLTAIQEIEQGWTTSRWTGITRPYKAEDVWRLRGYVQIEHTLAKIGAEKLWQLLHERPFVRSFGALTGHQAVQMVTAGLEAIYVSGWQVAGDANLALQTYPDQSLYPPNSVPTLVRRINRAFQREDEKATSSPSSKVIPTNVFAPIVADAEAGFGGDLNVFELVEDAIDAGAAAVHLEDQLASAKKCGHLGGKVLVPTSEFIRKLAAARLAADISGVPTIIIARTDADAAKFVTSEVDRLDQPFLDGDRTPEGFWAIRDGRGGLDMAVSRALSYAPYADMLWCETSKPNINEARAFARAVHSKFPGKLLAYNCSPSFNWKKHLNDAEISAFQDELGKIGYKFQFITLAGFHLVNFGAFELARDYAARGMSAYVDLQEREFAAQSHGYAAARHQEFVGTEYFDRVAQVISGGTTSTLAMEGSTEKAQFDK